MEPAPGECDGAVAAGSVGGGAPAFVEAAFDVRIPLGEALHFGAEGVRRGIEAALHFASVHVRRRLRSEDEHGVEAGAISG